MNIRTIILTEKKGYEKMSLSAVNGSSNSHSLFEAKDKQPDYNQKDQNDWDQKYAHRYGANAAVWTVAAGGGYVQ